MTALLQQNEMKKKILQFAQTLDKRQLVELGPLGPSSLNLLVAL